MALLLESYHVLYQQLAECQKIYDKCTEDQIENRKKLESEYRDLEKYSVTYRAQLENATKKVETFINLSSVLCNRRVESQVPLKYDNSKLTQLMVQANSAFNGSIYAEQLYTEASGQLLYLQREIAGIDKKLAEQKAKLVAGSVEAKEEDMLRAKEASVRAMQILKEQPFREFLRKLEENYSTYVEGQMKENAEIDTISIGVAQMPLPLAGNSVESLGISGNIYDEVHGGLNMPVDFSIHQPMVLGVVYDGLMEKTLLGGIQNYILNVLRYGVQVIDDILFVDPIRFSNVGLGSLMQICGVEGSILEKVPVSKEDTSARVNALINKLNHQTHDRRRERGRKLLVFHDFPEGYRSDTVEAIRQLCANAEYYGVSVIVTYNTSVKSSIVEKAYEELKFFLTAEIDCVDGQFAFGGEQEKFLFRWYQAPAALELSILERFIRKDSAMSVGNDYLERIGIPKKPVYDKGIRKITNIPYGIGESGKISYLDFEDSNFASFICGAARSGKSTLLHTLLTGVLKTMHPDDVEIWLIDFKMTEFSRYVNHLPPHVRYIILDESPELVYDIVDRLTDILKKRQNVFMGKWQKLDDVPKERYMPVMFIVIDEFSVMSHIIADADSVGKGDYKIKMQTLLAKGAALGMRFIFSSQGFTSGSRGLSDFSKKQIQQRIAMKTEYQEIVETLDLQSKSDSDKLQMEELDVHHALVRIPPDNNGNHLKLSKVLYISDYAKQEQFIDNINDAMHSELKYDVTNTESYIDKKTLILDGNRYLSFQEKQAEIEEYIINARNRNGESVLHLFLGSPKRLLSVYGVEFSDEFGENVLLMAPSSEKMAASSVLMSIAASLELEHKGIEIWTIRKNSIYRQMVIESKQKVDSVSRDLDEVCESIRAVKEKIQSRIDGEKFIVLLGFETLIMDMGYQGDTAGNSVASHTISGVQGIVIEERKPEELDLASQLDGLNGIAVAAPGINIEPQAAEDSLEKVILNTREDIKGNAYDARNDLKYILTQGPKLGYHFIMVFNTVGEFNQSKLNASLFKHKILFRLTKTDVVELIGSANARVVSELEDHSFRYTNGLEALSFRPFLHRGLAWDGWQMDGAYVTSNLDEEEYLM